MKRAIKTLIVAGLALATLSTLGSCTKYNIIETGYANGKHNTSMMGYFSEAPYNWSLTQQLIKHAGVESIFTAEATTGKGITFLGITDFSILRYILQLQEKENAVAEEEGREPKKITLEDIPQEEAKEMILNCVIPERLMLADIPAGKPSTDEETLVGTGGKVYQTLGGSELWVYTFREAYNGIPNTGAVSIYVVSADKEKRVQIASSDIQTLTGVVHSLPYSFTLGEF